MVYCGGGGGCERLSIWIHGVFDAEDFHTLPLTPRIFHMSSFIVIMTLLRGLLGYERVCRMHASIVCAAICGMCR